MPQNDEAQKQVRDAFDNFIQTIQQIKLTFLKNLMEIRKESDNEKAEELINKVKNG